MTLNKKRLLSLLLALMTVVLLLGGTAMLVGAEDGGMTDSKTVFLEYSGEPIDVSKLFDTQPAGAVYSIGKYDASAAYELNGTMMTVITPGSFRVEQEVDGEKTWIALGVHVSLTVTVKDQECTVGEEISSTTADATFSGLLEGHTVTAVTLTAAVGDEVGSHDVIKAVAVTVMEGDKDVSTYYNVKSVDGILHLFSAEWGVEDDCHFHVCSAFGCDKESSSAAHTFENACDSACDVCFKRREVPDHVWSEGFELIEATEEEPGVRIYACMACGEPRSEIIPKVEPVPVFLIVCLCVACAAVGGCVAYVAVRHTVKKAAAAAASEEKTEEKTEE